MVYFIQVSYYWRKKPGKQRMNMKFKTKLAITFLTMFLLPLALSCFAFFAIGTILLRSMNLYPGMEHSGFSMFSNTVESYSQATNELVNEILETSRFRPHDF